jgi:dihydrofolate synthase/folylpolyglutamate synthase
MYQRVGVSAYKKDLGNTLALCEALGNPERKFNSVHIAGTNGKGSTSNMLAAIFSAAGYKTGLYTSPHLKDFRERIRIGGQMISQNDVVAFVKQNQELIERVCPSFFELTVAMCFEHFGREKVDWGVIETGLGGRLDSTNVIEPKLSVITNISWDHSDMLGDTLEKIAFEKAGIIKKGVPVVLGESQKETLAVFEHRAAEMQAELIRADQMVFLQKTEHGLKVILDGKTLIENLKPNLLGEYQHKNIATTMAASLVLGLPIEAMVEGIENVCSMTGFRGRWEKLGEKPLIVCDIAHNQAGIEAIVKQIANCRYHRLLIVLGMVADKDHSKILPLLPKEAHYFFCCPAVPRGLPAEQLSQKAAQYGLHGSCEASVGEAFEKAKKMAQPDDMIYVGGSTFVVAEVI